MRGAGTSDGMGEGDWEGTGSEAFCDVDDSLPTYAPRIILSISVSFSSQTASSERDRIGGAGVMPVASRCGVDNYGKMLLVILGVVV